MFAIKLNIPDMSPFMFLSLGTEKTCGERIVIESLSIVISLGVNVQFYIERRT